VLSQFLYSQLKHFVKYFAKLNFKQLVAVREFGNQIELQHSGDLPKLN
jgi:hypothetical protein